VDLAQALYNQAADLQKEGVGTGIDTLRVPTWSLQNENQRLLEAQASRDTSLFGLSRLLNLDPRQTIELGDSLSFFDTPQPDVQASIEEAWRCARNGRRSKSRFARRKTRRMRRARRDLPSLHFSGNWAELGTTTFLGDSDLHVRRYAEYAAVHRRPNSRGAGPRGTWTFRNSCSSKRTCGTRLRSM